MTQAARSVSPSKGGITGAISGAITGALEKMSLKDTSSVASANKVSPTLGASKAPKAPVGNGEHLLDQDQSTREPLPDHVADDEIGLKVFFGNLSFSTTEEELNDFAGEQGPVKSTTIITRGVRSLGYGFAIYESEEAATVAVEALDKKELLGRPVNVELAKPKIELAKRLPGTTRGRGRGGRGRGRGGRGRGGRGGFTQTEGDETLDENAGEESTGGDVEGGRGRRGRRGGRGGRGRGAFSQNNETRIDDETAEYEGGETEEGGRGRRRGRGRGRGGRGRGRGGRATVGPDGEPLPEPPAPEPSKVVLYVGNLPWKVNDDDLESIFKDYSVVGARVARLHSERSRGYGFVLMVSEEEQTRALSELKDVVVDNRPLTIKIATSRQEKIFEPESAPTSPAPAEEEA